VLLVFLGGLRGRAAPFLLFLFQPCVLSLMTTARSIVTLVTTARSMLQFDVVQVCCDVCYDLRHGTTGCNWCYRVA
jgi:hypothetical protein